jgi:hypothetical protein
MEKTEREKIKDDFQAATSKLWELVYSQQETIFALELELEEWREAERRGQRLHQVETEYEKLMEHQNSADEPSDPFEQVEKPFIYLSKGSKNWNVQFDSGYLEDIRRVTIDIGTSGSVTIDADGQRYWIDMANNQVVRPEDE